MKAKRPVARTAADASWRKMLDARPVRNAAARAERNDEGRWEVRVPSKRPAYLVPPLTWMVRPPKHRLFVLDDLGGWVWEQCDGERTVEAIVEAFSAVHRLTFHEGRVAVTGYLRDLIRRGVLAVAVPANTG